MDYQQSDLDFAKNTLSVKMPLGMDHSEKIFSVGQLVLVGGLYSSPLGIVIGKGHCDGRYIVCLPASGWTGEIKDYYLCKLRD